MNNDSKDLIKRGAVCDMLHEEMEAWGSCADEIEALLKANDALWEIAAVDAVEVVRCGECIHRRKGIMPNCHGRHPNWFCADGERREDG